MSLLQGAHQSHAGLHLVLFSEPGLDRRIDALQIIDVAVYDFELPNFSPSELSQFLARDPAIENQLNSSLVQKLWVSSQGFPGSALALMRGSDQPTEKGASGLRGLFDFGIPYGHIAAIGLLAIILLWSLLGREGEAPAPVKAKVALPSSTPVAVIGGSEDEVAVQDEVAVSVDDASPFLLEDEPSEGAADSDNGVQNSAEASVVVDSEAERPGEAPVIDSSDDLAADDRDWGDDEVIDDLRFPPQMPERLPEIAEEETIETLPSRLGLNAPKALNDAEVFLMAQNSDFYSLQVIAASKKASLDAYVARQSNRDTLYMYRGKREGKSWYVVVQGVYSSRESALQGLRMLPKEQSKAGPWPRKLSAIQEEIEEFRLD